MPKKSPAQLDREIAESIAYWKARGRTEAPTSFPKTLRHGGYTATFQGIESPGTPQATAKWEIKRGRQVVGTMHEGWSYGWGRPTITTRQLTWAGPLPPGVSDPRSLHYGWSFDLGPFDSYADAMAELAKHADRLIQWREKQGGKGKRSHSTIATATRDYEYVVYPEASHRHAERAVKIHMRRGKGPYDLADAKREAKQMGPPAAIYSVSKGRFVGYIHPSGRYVPFGRA